MRLQTVRFTFILCLVLTLFALVPTWSRAAKSPAAAAASITLPAAADTYVDSTAPDTNFGQDSYLDFSYSSTPVQSGSFMLFRFDVQEALGPEAIIDSATLELYQISGGGASAVAATIHPILEPWTENGVTFNNQPDVYIGPFLLFTTLDAQTGWKQINVTNLAQGWQDGSGHGVELRSTKVDFTRAYESTEHNERMPRLVIQYHLPTPTPTPTNTNTPQTPPSPTNTPTPSPTATPFAQTLELCAVADATVNEADPDSSYGMEPLLQVGYGQGQNEPFAQRALLRFDLGLIPAGTEVVEAEFQAGQVLADGQNLVQLALYAVRGAWTETAVTWNNQPPVSPAPAASTAVDDGVPTIITWDLRDLVREWVSGGMENNGLELRGPQGGLQWLRGYDSRHHMPFCPRLVIKVLSSAPIPTPTPRPSATPTATPTDVCPNPDAAGNSFADAAPLSPNQDISELLCPSGDFDYWKFPIEAGQEIKLSLWGMVGDYDLTLLDPNGALVKESALWGAGKNETITHLSYQNGDFRAVVKGKGVADWHPSKPYMIKFDAPFKCFDPDEAGNDFASAKEILPSLPQSNIQHPLHGAICPEGDIDFYKFNVPGGQTVTIRADLTELPADFDLILRDPSGKLIDYSSSEGKTADWVQHTANNVPGWWRVSVFGPKAADGSSPYHSGLYKLDVKLTSPTDLTVAGIEITQAIQDKNNSVNLVAEKLTMARVYIAGGSDPGPLGVPVRLRAWRVAGGKLYTLPGEVKTTAHNLPLLTLDQSRLNNTASVNAYLPKEWIEGGVIRLEAELNPDQTMLETNYSNNKAYTDVTFRKVQPISIRIVPVQVGTLVLNPQTDANVLNMLAWTQQVFPTHVINLTHNAGPLVANYNYNFPVPFTGNTCGPGWGALLGDLQTIYDNWNNRPQNAVVFGVIDPGVTPGSGNGCGAIDSGVSGGIIGAGQGPLLAHEMGHNYNRAHVNCGLPAGATFDAGYPTYLNPSGTAYAVGSTGEVGIDTRDATIHDPQTARDFMSYCNSEWISPYTWTNILSKMPNGVIARPAVAAAVPHIVISGDARAGTLSFEPFWVQERPAGSADQPGSGPYSIKLVDGTDQVLVERRLEIEMEPSGVNHNPGHFREWLRYPEGTAAIGLYKDGRLLLERKVSVHAPQVTLLTPNGGEQWAGTGPYTVRWQAGDADQDQLTANVLYSPDNGVNWQALAVNLGGSEVTLDTPYLPGTTEARIKVLVTDGVNTTADQSDSAFQVDDKPPMVFLLGPRAGTSYAVGEAVILQAVATDPEDGPLASDDLQWTLPSGARTSAIGSDVVLENLTAGEYVFKVTAHDAGGNATTRETKVIVGWRQFLPAIAAK